MTDTPIHEADWQRRQRQPAPQKLSHELTVLMRQLVSDLPAKVHRLSAYELGFWRTIEADFKSMDRFMRLSERQEAILRRIEAKVYAAG